MSEQLFIQLALDQVQAALVCGTEALLTSRNREAFNSFNRMFVGMAQNPPQLWVMPERTVLAEEGSMIASVSDLRVAAAVVAGEPEQVVLAAVDYVWAIDQALRYPAKPWDARIMRVFVGSHEYGPVYVRTSGFARYPEVKVFVQMQEVG